MLSEPVDSVTVLSWVVIVTGVATGIARSLLFHGRITLPHRVKAQYQVDPGFLGHIIIGCVASALSILHLQPNSLNRMIAVGLIGGLGGNAILEAYAGKTRSHFADTVLTHAKDIERGA